MLTFPAFPGGYQRGGGLRWGIFEGFVQIQPNPAKTPGLKCLALDSFQNSKVNTFAATSVSEPRREPAQIVARSKPWHK